MKNIFLVNHYAGSRIHGMALRPYLFALKSKDLEIHHTIIAGSYCHQRYRNPERVKFPYSNESIDGVHYVWVWTTKYKGNGIGRFLNIWIFCLLLPLVLLMTARKKRPNAIVSSSYNSSLIVVNLYMEINE